MITAQTPLSVSQVTAMCNYVKFIYEDYCGFKSEQENAILFGRQTEMADIRRADLEMRVVPVTREHFQLISNPKFV